ncbi:hypothetical protein HMPREF0880_03918 [Yokenella regensburgei ATCC 43003]|nr:hypothetical protein HMPREF0880_03918 [Yokenella regensburgei ATCC 43003]
MFFDYYFMFFILCDRAREISCVQLMHLHNNLTHQLRDFLFIEFAYLARVFIQEFYNIFISLHFRFLTQG